MQGGRSWRRAVAAGVLSATAYGTPAVDVDSALPAATMLCLFEIPAPPGRRVWLNLALVQYVEQRPGELRIYYGGGHFGSGHEARIPVRDATEAATVLGRMAATAARCVHG